MEGGAPRRPDRSVSPESFRGRPSIFYALRCADFGRQSLRPSCRMKIHPCTFVVRKGPEKSSSNAAHICFPEIGGTKKRGGAPSGISNGKMVKWFGVTNRRELGSWMGFMIKRNR